MEIIKIEKDFVDNKDNQYLVMGHFNVIHQGHFNLFKNLEKFSFFIFENNPSKLYRIYNLKERIQNLSKFNPENVYVYDILQLNLDSTEFIEKILKKIKFKTIVVGSDFKFGKNRNGNVELLKKYFDVKVVEVDTINSTKHIHNLLKDGKIEEANNILMHNFYYENKVVDGKKMARKMFKPTANILDEKTMDLKSGSYVSITFFNNKYLPSISFIGIPKSFEDNRSFVETHIFDFDEDIYNKTIKVYPISFIRENQKFNDINILKKNIINDFEVALNYFKTFDWNKFKP